MYNQVSNISVVKIYFCLLVCFIIFYLPFLHVTVVNKVILLSIIHTGVFLFSYFGLLVIAVLFVICFCYLAFGPQNCNKLDLRFVKIKKGRHPWRLNNNNIYESY